MARLPTILSLAILSGACGGSNSEGPSLFIPFPADSGAVTDATSPSDVAQAPDQVAVTDAPSNPVEAGGRDDGSMPAEYGTCGRAVHNAICACDPTDTACVDRAFGASTACDGCIADAQATCCMTQADALDNCARAAGCSDLACARTRCSTQIRAFETCIGTQWEQAERTMSGTCYQALVGCLGSYPVACGM